jgi:hypothetical protein
MPLKIFLVECDTEKNLGLSGPIRLACGWCRDRTRRGKLRPEAIFQACLKFEYPPLAALRKKRPIYPILLLPFDAINHRLCIGTEDWRKWEKSPKQSYYMLSSGSGEWAHGTEEISHDGNGPFGRVTGFSGELYRECQGPPCTT